MNRVGNEILPQRVHLHERRHTGGIAEVICVHTFCHRRAGVGLDGDDSSLLALRQVLVKEWEA